MAKIQKLDLGEVGIQKGSTEAVLAIKLNEIIDEMNYQSSEGYELQEKSDVKGPEVL
jgi:hypothetical protein